MWIRWMQESGGQAEQSWEVWWKEENSFFRALSLSWKVFLFLQKSCLWLFISWGLGGNRLARDSGEQGKVLEVSVQYAWCRLYACSVV